MASELDSAVARGESSDRNHWPAMGTARTADSKQAAPIDRPQWTSFHTLRNGTTICIRPLWPDDREREVAFIESLSEQTRYFRMMSPLRFLSQHLLDQLMAIDYSQSMAFAATVGAGAAEEFVGLARYGMTDEPSTVELGITVADRWHRQGIARELIDPLVRYATLQGFHKMIGWVLYENQPMLTLGRACGFRARIAPEHGAMEIVRELTSGAVPPGSP
jgi:acetyltransferase